MGQRLVIALDACSACAKCTAGCSYPHHPDNDGVSRLRERAAEELVCRRCEARACVQACPNEALEAQAEGALRRYMMRCTACLSCSHACPFGTLVPAALQFTDGACDFCLSRAEVAPECARTCPLGALKFENVPSEGAEVHLVGERFAVRAKVWPKIEPVAKK